SLSNGVLRAVYRRVNSSRRFRRSKLSEPRCCDLELPCAKVFMAPRCPSHLAISRLPDLGRGAGASWASSGGKLPEPLGLRTRTCKWPAVKPWIAAKFSLALSVCAEGPRNFFLKSEVSPFQAPNRRRIVAIKASPSGSYTSRYWQSACILATAVQISLEGKIWSSERRTNSGLHYRPLRRTAVWWSLGSCWEAL